LNVSASPIITVTPADTLYLFSDSPVSAPDALTIDVKSSGGPVPFSVRTTTDPASNWLLVAPARGTAPATLSVTADPAKLGDSNRGYGVIAVTGPGNSRMIRVSYYVNTNTASPVLLSARAGTSVASGDPLCVVEPWEPQFNEG